MLEMNPFAYQDDWPSWMANAFQRFLSVAASGFSIVQTGPTHVKIPAAAGDQAAVVAIGGLWRWMEADLGPVAHPGGAAGVYPVFVTAKNNTITNAPVPFSDHTDYTFGLQILAPGATPVIVPGTVDVYRHVGDVHWDGAQIVRVHELVPVDKSARGPWLTVTNITAGVLQAAGTEAPPAARLDGDRVELAGTFFNGTGANMAGGTAIAKLPSPLMYPAGTKRCGGSFQGTTPGTLGQLMVDTSGFITSTGLWAAGALGSFDGLGFALR